jgi:hypothetical protein
MIQQDTFQRIRQGLRAALAVLLVSLALPTAAQQPGSAQISAIRQACRADYQANCAGVPTGGAAAMSCLQENAMYTSPSCQQALRAASGGGAAATAARPAASTDRAAAADSWPHTLSGASGSAVVYQPQVIAWPDRQTLRTRIALSVTPAGAAAAVLGTVEVSFATSTDLSTRWVTLSNPQLVSSRFPAADTAQAERIDAHIRSALAALPRQARAAGHPSPEPAPGDRDATGCRGAQ